MYFFLKGKTFAFTYEMPFSDPNYTVIMNSLFGGAEMQNTFVSMHQKFLCYTHPCSFFTLQKKEL